MSDQHDVIVILVSIVALMVLMCSFICVFVLKYRQKQKEHEREKMQIKLEQERELAQVELEISEDVLKNISHEIHDNIGHALSVAKLTLHSINSENLEEKSQATLDILTATITDLRNLSKSMNGNYIREIGLDAALVREVEILNSTGNILCSYQNTAAGAHVSKNNQVILFRCIQEVANNALKHAQAKSIQIESSSRQNYLVIVVTDDGIGFNIRDKSLNGIGMGSLKERVRLMEGKLHLYSSANKGTTVKFEIPLFSDQI